MLYPLSYEGGGVLLVQVRGYFERLSVHRDQRLVPNPCPTRSATCGFLSRASRDGRAHASWLVSVLRG